MTTARVMDLWRVELVSVRAVFQARDRGLGGVGDAHHEAEPARALIDLDEQTVPALLELDGDVELVRLDGGPALLLVVDLRAVDPRAAAVVVAEVQPGVHGGGRLD